MDCLLFLVSMDPPLEGGLMFWKSRFQKGKVEVLISKHENSSNRQTYTSTIHVNIPINCLPMLSSSVRQMEPQLHPTNFLLHLHNLNHFVEGFPST